MQSATSSVRVSAISYAILDNLASQTGQSRAQIVERALRELEERLFWAEVQAAYENRETVAEAKAEAEVWDCTLMDGLESYPWDGPLP